MQELIWYIQCYGPWVSAGFAAGVILASVVHNHGSRPE